MKETQSYKQTMLQELDQIKVDCDQKIETLTEIFQPQVKSDAILNPA